MTEYTEYIIVMTGSLITIGPLMDQLKKNE